MQGEIFLTLMQHQLRNLMNRLIGHLMAVELDLKLQSSSTSAAGCLQQTPILYCSYGQQL